jgi:hypothetical protein
VFVVGSVVVSLLSIAVEIFKLETVPWVVVVVDVDVLLVVLLVCTLSILENINSNETNSVDRLF